MNRVLAIALCGSLALPAVGADFKSISETGTVFYDAPSSKAKKMFVVSRDYPVEIMVSMEGWAKVRDPSGDLLWVERRNLSDRRTVVVTVPVAEVRQAGGERAAVAFRVQQGVVLDLSETGSDGWVRVRHRDGQSGFLRIKDVWGL